MMSNLRPYPEYKDSGNDWLGRVPVHWDCLPHRALFDDIKEQGYVEEPLLSVTISKGVIRQADLLTDSSKKDSSNLDKSNYKLVEPGDIAYNKMRAWQGAVGVSRHRGIVSPAYIVVRLRTAGNPDYFHFLFRTPGFAKEAERWSYGITSDMWSLRPEHFKRIYSCVPPRLEQDAIVDFLRRLDTRVRHFTLNRRRLINLLKEQKQAIITQAVTRGLDPNVPLKPSGVDWIGDIPAHWRVASLKRACARSALYGANIPASTYINSGIRFVRTTDITDEGFLRPGGVFVDPTVVPDCVLAEGDLLLSRSGTIGRSLCYRRVRHGACAYAGYLVRFVPNQHAVPDYLFYYTKTRAFADFVRVNAISSTIDNVNGQKFASMAVTLPPQNEQDRIATRVEIATSHLDRSLSAAQRQIDLIREYRTRLIADVVTGKVDVRHLVPPTEDARAEAELEDLDEGLLDGTISDDDAELAEEVADADD